jgi:hypothetical protein
VARVRSLRSIRPGIITVERSSSIGPALLFAPLVVATMALPWVMGRSSSLLGALVTTLAGVVWVGGAALLTIRRGRVDVVIPPEAELVLAEPHEGDDATYRVLIEGRGSLEPLLEHRDPAQALLDLRRLRDELGLPVRAGWGLSESAIACSEQSPPATLRSLEVRGPRWQAQGRTALAACLGSLFILGVTVFTFSKVASQATALSRLLPIVFASLIALAGLTLLLLRLRVRLTPQGIRFDTSILTLSLFPGELAGREILRADAVGARGDRPQHVLLQTSRGPRSLPLCGPAARAVTAAIVAAPSRPKDSGVSWTPAARDRARPLEENPC